MGLFSSSKSTSTSSTTSINPSSQDFAGIASPVFASAGDVESFLQNLSASQGGVSAVDSNVLANTGSGTQLTVGDRGYLSISISDSNASLGSAQATNADVSARDAQEASSILDSISGLQDQLSSSGKKWLIAGGVALILGLGYLAMKGKL